MPPSHQRLLHEIQDQPACLTRILDAFPAQFESITLPGFFTQKLIGIGEGSSFNALKIAAPFIEEMTGLNTFTFDPESLENKFEVSQWIKHPVKRLFERSYFMAVSQSGKTSSILNVIDHLQEALGFANHHAPLLSITNNAQGQLATQYANHIDLCVGEERSIAATKSMTASILTLMLFGLRLGQKRTWLKRGDYQAILDTLKPLPENLNQLLLNSSLQEHIFAFAQRLKNSNQFVLLSKGLLSLVLPEAGLKLTETSSNIVWTDNTESFKHGRKVILKGVHGYQPNCIYVIPPKLTHKESENLFHDIHAHFFKEDELVYNTEGVFLITFENSPPVPQELQRALNIQPSDILTLPACSGTNMLFATLLVFQVLSYALALAKGENPNNPALVKAVVE